MKKIFFNKLIKLSLSRFNNFDKKKLLKSLLDGNIIVVKKAVDKKKIMKICENLHNQKLKPSKSTKMYEGVKNIYYKAEVKPNKNEDSKRYRVSNKSWYFFPWNKDKTKLIELVQPVYNNVIKLNGYEPKDIKKKTPKDGIIQRFHLMNYPYGNGFISRHVDPVTIVKCTAGIYISEFGKNYSAGGFYVIDKYKRKKHIDKNIKSSDMVLFYSSMPHGVDKIKKPTKELKINELPGRWFLNMTLVSSHHVKNRITSKGY